MFNKIPKMSVGDAQYQNNRLIGNGTVSAQFKKEARSPAAKNAAPVVALNLDAGGRGGATIIRSGHIMFQTMNSFNSSVRSSSARPQSSHSKQRLSRQKNR